MATARELIERLSKLDPEEHLWYSYATKSETEDYFVEGCKIKDEDWQGVIENFGGDFEYFQETVADNVSAETCEECGLLDYQAEEIGGETLCSQCGEEPDLLAE